LRRLEAFAFTRRSQFHGRPHRLAPGTSLLVSTALVGFVLAALKAWWAPITTDEAWSLNYWVRRGPLFIWTDYTESNNHLLNTLAMWAVAHSFGESEISLRIPGLMGNAAFLGGAILLARQLIERSSLRLAFVAVAACHPYLVDFGALARGYALGMGFLFLALAGLCAAVHAEARGTPPSPRSLGLASLGLGLAVASVPIMVQPAAAVAVIYLALTREWRSRAGSGLRLALVLPGVAVVAATYAGVVGKMSRQRFYFGAHDWSESVRSLASLLAYQWPVSSKPFDAARDAGATGASGLDAALPLLGITFLNLAVAARLVREPTRRSASLPGLALAGVVVLLAIDHAVFGLPLPRDRTWLAVVPLFLLASFVSADALAGRLRGHAGKTIGLAAAGASFLGLFLLFRSFDFMAYREWPEDAPLREVIAILRGSGAADAPAVSLEFPWPMEAPLIYYEQREGGRKLELRSKLPEQDADADYLLAQGAAAKQPHVRQELVRDYPRSGVTLYRRQRTGGTPEAADPRFAEALVVAALAHLRLPQESGAKLPHSLGVETLLPQAQ